MQEGELQATLDEMKSLEASPKHGANGRELQQLCLQVWLLADSIRSGEYCSIFHRQLMQEQKLRKTQSQLEEAQTLQGTYKAMVKQLQTDQAIVVKDIADLQDACKQAEKRVLALQVELKQRASENNAAMPTANAALEGLNKLRHEFGAHLMH